jgi:putative transposase
VYARRMDLDAPRLKWRRQRLAGFDYSGGDYAYFVTIRAALGTVPFRDDRLARVVLEALDWMREHRRVALYAFCLMPDHLHSLMQLAPDSASLSTIIGAFKRFTTRQSWQLGYQGRLWQPSFHDHILRKSEDGLTKANYILDNPKRSGLAENRETYPYSGTPDPLM